MYVYEYSNGIQKKHSCLISNKTILKESEEAKQVSIYKITNDELEKRKFVETLLLRY